MDSPQQGSKKKPLFSRGLLSLASMLAIASLSFASHAASVYTVSTDSDEPSNYSDGSSACGSPCTLRAAIRAANANGGADTIIIPDGFNPHLNYGDSDPKGIDENAAKLDDLDITGDLTITGQGSSRNIINAAGLIGGVGDRVFHILNGADVTFNNVSIQGGHLTIEVDGDDNIIGTPAGAGIFIQASSYVTLNNVEVTDNTITTNSSADFTTVGGGIYVADTATIIINDSDITDNKAPSGGGINNAGRADIRRTLIDNNEATDLNDPTADSSSGGGGGGINNQGGYLSLGTSTLSNNSSTQLGGGINSANLAQNNGNIVITNSVVFNNHAEFGGSGIASFGPLSINNSAITENTALSTTTAGSRGNGAGIFNHGLGNLDMVNSTVSHNTGAHSGGGIFSARDISLTNVTIYDNEAEPCTSGADCVENSRLGGNQIALFTSSDSRPSMLLSNTIIGDGPGSNPAESPCDGSTGYTGDILSQGYNMESSDSCGLVIAKNDQVNIAIADLGLAALRMDPSPPASIELIGGRAAASEVNALEAGSPAINNGTDESCPLVDQRFMVRDTCDVGAYEYGATEQQGGNSYVDLKATIADTPDPVAPNNTQQPLTYIIVVTNLYVDNPANDVTISIDLPDTYSVSPGGISFSATGTKPTCTAPKANNIVSCQADSIDGLGRVEIFISGYPLVEGTITAKVDVNSHTSDAFQQNNVNITEDTVVDSKAGCVTNFGCSTSTSGGGGGALHPFALLLTTLILLGRRFRTAC